MNTKETYVIDEPSAPDGDQAGLFLRYPSLLDMGRIIEAWFNTILGRHAVHKAIENIGVLMEITH